MATGSKDRASRAERERARLYQARQSFHEGQQRRRRRDNLIAGVAGGFLIAGIVAAQTAYFTVGPGAPEPAPSPTQTSVPSPSDGSTPEPTPLETTPVPSSEPTGEPSGDPSAPADQ